MRSIVSCQRGSRPQYRRPKCARTDLKLWVGLVLIDEYRSGHGARTGQLIAEKLECRAARLSVVIA